MGETGGVLVHLGHFQDPWEVANAQKKERRLGDEIVQTSI